MQVAGLATRLPTCSLGCSDLEEACPCIHTAGILSEGIGERVSAPVASWHDDLVLMIATDHPDALLPGVSFAVRRVHDLMAHRNLQLNLSAGETEVLCIPAGSGSARLRSFIRKPEVQHCAFLPDHGCMATVRIVDHYKHLGSWICDSSSLLPEIRYRLAYARSALRTLRKPVFARPGVSEVARTYLFRSLILSRACHNIGALSGLTEGEWDVWQEGILGLYKVLLPRSEFAVDAHVSAPEICRRALLPAPVALVRNERLRLLGQLVEKGAVTTRDLLEAAVGSSRCWLSDVEADVRWCRELSPHLFPGLPVDGDVAALWKHVARGSSRHLLMAKVRALAVEHSADDLRPPPANALSPHTCSLCKRVFKGKRGLAAHVALVHGLRSKFKGLVSGTQCCACNFEFHTRSRLIKHVQRYSAGCRRFYLTHVARQGLDAQQEADNAERLRLKESRGRGRLDRAVAHLSAATLVPLADDQSEEDVPVFS